MEPNNPYNAPTQSTPAASRPVGMRTVAIKKIDVVSAGTMLGATYALIGLIIGGFMSLLAVLGVAAGGGGGDAVMGGLLTGVGALIIIPLLYGAAGFIGGMIGAVIYNVVAGFVGGIRMDLEG